jgi:hypothetical protein
MTHLTLFLLWSSSVGFALIGVFFLLMPDQATAAIGVELTNATARTDIMATYGGMMLGMGAFYGWVALSQARYEAGLWSVLLVYAGLALGRTWAIVGGERPGAMMWSFLAIEMTVAALAALALSRSSTSLESP